MSKNSKQKRQDDPAIKEGHEWRKYKRKLEDKRLKYEDPEAEYHKLPKLK
jgi:hypothetical protein